MRLREGAVRVGERGDEGLVVRCKLEGGKRAVYCIYLQYDDTYQVGQYESK